MRLSSLRQLTLISFVLALVPLAVLLWHSQSTLSYIAKATASETAFSVSLAREIGEVESVATDVERLIRQYHVFRRPQLKDLAETYVSKFNQGLANICEAIEGADICIDMHERQLWLAEFADTSDEVLLDAQLAEFARALTILRSEVDRFVDQRIQKLRQELTDIQYNQAWYTGWLVTISLLLVVFGSQQIVRPVKKVEDMITAIADQNAHLPSVSRNGPRELIELEGKLHWLSNRLTQLENLRQALLRHASHELKTPLASIKEGCSLLTEQVVGELNEQQKEVLQLLNSSAERLNLLVEQLLDYNMLLQQAQPVYERIETEPFIQEFLTENGLAIQQNNHQVDLSMLSKHLYVDVKLFRRILDNLLSNAIAHGVKGRPINIKIYQQNGDYVLDVANRGAKVDPQQRIQLFEPFKRGEGKRNDRVVGSGLGLSIVADCARMMKGVADIVDVDYADFCVRVVLPNMETTG